MDEEIFFDVETTGLFENEALPLAVQPFIIEIGAARGDRTLSRLVNPGVPLPPKITEITGLRDSDLSGAPPFAEVWRELAEFFLGARRMLAHNAHFDHTMLGFELRRCGREFQFPWCPELIDTRTVWPGKLKDWIVAAGVRAPDDPQRHRALDDALDLRRCWEWSKQSAYFLAQ